MTSPKVFLTAEWKQLVMLNYAVDPDLLAPFVPAGTELDGCEGCIYVSLVGFQFNDTRVAGCAIPFHRSFEEVNLRFYVRRSEKRGVVFIRELVPKIAIAATARLFYGEKYSCVPMAHRIYFQPEKDAVEAEYSWGAGPQRCAMRIETVGNNLLPADGSLGQFITEHYWGYAAQKDGGCVEYEVQHPRWTVRDAGTANLSGEAARYYGPAFGNVLMRPPDSAFLAEGSAVTVFRGRRIG
ncbi:MAG: DUF2071 domain-containing protein [Terracidiphilus sp.]|jgi:uncharacterized protein YqjF (DUF2071 family)